MNKILPVMALTAGALTFTPCSAKSGDLLPKPHQITLATGQNPFLLQRAVALDDATGCAALRQFLTSNGCEIQDGAAAAVKVTLVDELPGSYDYELSGFANEAYSLEVTANAINIRAVTPTGVIRAAQTLTQLAEGYDEGTPAQVEALTITDWPAFKLRGWMQDVGRSFLAFEELKKEVDLMSRFKINVFHWHLTEKLAWRFETKAYPALTKAENMIRYPGQYYTQEQCKELEAYAAERGVTVIPEIDMPGHSDVFTKTMGFDMQSEQGIAALKIILREVAEVFPLAPYIHIGGDEVDLKDGFLEGMASFVRNELGRKVVIWNPLRNKGVTKDFGDMNQLWSTAGKAVKGIPAIDCRYNYINHFDVYADLVGIYKSSIYYAQKGNPDIAGTITAAWNDTKVPTEEDIIRQNNLYANALASAERAWIGGGKKYIEAGGTTLPNAGAIYDEFADFERRFLFHKDHSLKDEPIPYVKQSNVRWRITEPFPNGGDASTVLPPETATDDILPAEYTYNGTTYTTKVATGAGIYLRHIWHPTIPSFFSNPGDNQTAYAWTYVYSPKAQDVSAQIEFYTYSRSGSEHGPAAGKWDRRGSQVWLNGQEIPAPQWERPDAGIPQDHATLGLTNENLTNREPVALHLNEGWNKVFMKLPHVNRGGTSRDKWQFTFVLTDLEGRHAVDGLVYSPDKSFDAPEEEPAPPTPNLSKGDEVYWYRINTPLRDSRYTTSQGVGKELIGNASATTASEWKFEDRGDGYFNIVNREDNSYVSPVAEYNKPLTTTSTEPATGWDFMEAATSGYFALVSEGTQFNQTQAGLGYKIYNWGNGSNISDQGCQFSFKLVKDDEPKPVIVPPTLSTSTDAYWYRFNTPLRGNRYPTSQGVDQDIVGNTTATAASEWKFMDRGDGSFDIINRADNSFVTPDVTANTALKTTASAPAAGWKFENAATEGYFIIISNSSQFNQTNNAGQGFKVFNWGGGTNTSDTGCQYAFTLVEHEGSSTGINGATSASKEIKVVDGRVVCTLPYRIYTPDGKGVSVARRLDAGTYLIQTAEGTAKVVVK